MTLSLYQKLAFALAGLFTLLAVGLGAWTQYIDEQSRLQAEQRLHIGLAEHLVTDNPRVKQGFYDYEDLSNLFHTMMVLGPAFEFYLLDPQGKILTYSAPKEKIKRDSVSLVPIQQLIDSPAILPVLGDDPRNSGRSKIFSTAAIQGENGLQGYLYVIIGGEQYDSAFAIARGNSQQQQSLMFIIAALIFLFVAMLILLRMFTAPVRKLSDAMIAFQRSDFVDIPTAVSHVDSLEPSPDIIPNEVVQLSQIYQHMAARIQQQIGQLRDNDAQRRELLAQLSHDLRTPLAALQGYLETLELKAGQLSQADQASFVQTALRNAQLLKTLVDQIFELAHLESGQVTIDVETFPLAELLHDISAKFSLRAKEQQVQLVLPDPTQQNNVSTDIGKLERVLSNLIDNALRHTPSGGTVEIAVITEENGRLTIHVNDTGCGIAHNDLPYIFEARYRGSNALGEKHQHGGFGLAICQGLLGLLHSELHVESCEGKGSDFWFELSMRME